MVISNGFISQTKEEVIQELRKRIKGREIQPVPLPHIVDTMTYYISDIGELFGSQQHKTFYLTKPLKVETKSNIGASFRFALGNRKYKQEYLQNLMYWTFVSKEYIQDVDIGFKDSNIYNYQLDNLFVRQKQFPQTLYDNIYLLQSVYKSYFLEVAWWVRFVSMDISLDDAKDIASNTFFEICNTKYDYDAGNFVGLWKTQVRKRALDFLHFRNRFEDALFNENGEERIGGGEQDNFDIVDYKKHLNGEKTIKYFELYLQGESATDIAEVTGSTRNNVSSSISRSIQKLKEVYY